MWHNETAQMRAFLYICTAPFQRFGLHGFGNERRPGGLPTNGASLKLLTLVAKNGLGAVARLCLRRPVPDPGERKAQNVKLPTCRLFVIGAGFSVPAGLPLGNDLLERVRQDVRCWFPGAGWDGALEQEIEEWASLYPGETIDLERVLAYSHRKHYLRLKGSDEYYAHGSRSIVAARPAIQRILIGATPSRYPIAVSGFCSAASLLVTSCLRSTTTLSWSRPLTTSVSRTP